MSLRAGLTAATAILCLSAVITSPARAADPQLRLPAFEHLQELAVDSVNITFGPWPLSIASWALGHSGDPADRELPEVLREVKSVSIRSFKFAAEHQYDPADIDSVRSQLSSPEWKSLVRVHQKGDKAEDVDIYVSTDHDLVTGLAIIASGPREFTIVNIVGSVDPAKLAKVSDRLGLPALPM